MLTRKLFSSLSEYLGVNFTSELGFKIFFVFAFHFSVILYTTIGWEFSEIRYRIELFQNISIFSFIHLFQHDVFHLLHFIIIFRAFQNRKIQQRISNITSSLSSSEDDFKFLANVSVLFLAQIIKFAFTRTSWRIWHLKLTLALLVLASNDFMFLHFISSMRKDLQRIKHQFFSKTNTMSIKKFREKIFQNLQFKRDLQRRYSTDLFITVFYNFVQLIVALYFFCMRIMFNHMETLEGS